MKKNIIKIIILAAVLAFFYAGRDDLSFSAASVSDDYSAAVPEVGDSEVARIDELFRQKARDVHVRGRGRVSKVLPDDNQGSRHQRFILLLDNGHSLLFAHNIDLAPRLPDLRPGDEVGFAGDYIYNSRGGIIHWTHHDPRGRHPEGYLDYKGKRYR